MKNDSERYKIFLSALLHDIGKFVQRAQQNPKQQKHTSWGQEWLQDNLAEKISKIFGREIAQEILTEVNCHHDDTNYITKADCISSGMERIEKVEIENEEDDSPSNIRLVSVFSEIGLLYEPPKKKYNLISPLDYNNLKETIFPIDDNKCSYQEYKSLLEKFENSIKKIPDNLNESRFIETLYYLLQKYTWCVPSAVYKTEPDVSLFDHLKTTAAIAICLYDYEQSNNNNKDDKKFLLVGGDISGIQNFIYKITQSEGVKGVAKMLRGRSFYVSLLAEVVSKKIISELNLYPTNILFCGGGRFELLLPNTKTVENKIKEIESLTNKWLIENFEGELGLIIEKVPISSFELSNYSEYIKELDEKINYSKKRKFNEFLFQINNFNFIIKTTQNNKLITCKACNLKLISANDETKICNLCETHKKIGEYLPRLKAIIYAKNNLRDLVNENFVIDFSELGKVYLVCDGTQNIQAYINDPNIIEFKFVNNTDINFGGFCFLGNTVAFAKESFSLIDKSLEEFTYEKNEILDFETIASLSIGDRHLGLLKMDVDYLGLIFSIGFEREYSKLKSISRVSNLSRMMDLFFTGYVNKLCDEIFYDWYKQTDCDIKDKISQIFYISYSGGDDLLIIGPWSEIPKLAVNIRDEFKRFTCNNDNIDVSAGVLLVRPKFPIGKAALLCGEELEKSKNEGRKRITIFAETVKWTKDKDEQNDVGFDELLEFAENLYHSMTSPLDNSKKKLPRRFLNDLIRNKNQYIKKDKIDLNYIPFLIYKISRNIKEGVKIKLISGEEVEIKKYLWQKLISDLNSFKFFQYIKIPATYALLKSRKWRW